jgi:hypothetical protein
VADLRAATLVTTILCLRTARERWPISIGLSLAGFAFVYVLFEKGLAYRFLRGSCSSGWGSVAEGLA